MIIEWVEERLQECRGVSAAPWELVEVEVDGETKIEIRAEGGEPLTRRDAEFIVSMRSAYPLVLRELRKEMLHG